jgi:hypothetical protein
LIDINFLKCEKMCKTRSSVDINAGSVSLIMSTRIPNDPVRGEASWFDGSNTRRVWDFFFYFKSNNLTDLQCSQASTLNSH